MIIPNELGYFATLYRWRDLARAAEVIPMTVPGLRKAIRKLEQDVGHPLFVPAQQPADGPALEVTPYGELLYQMVCKWNADINGLTAEMNRIGAPERATIALGAALGTPGFLGLGFARAFERAHPEVSIRLIEASDYRIDQGLLTREFDMALCCWPFPEELDVELVHDEPVSVWVNRSSPLSAADELAPTDLEGQVFGIVDETCKVHAQVRDALRVAGVAPKAFVTSSELFWLWDFARRGQGLGFGIPHVDEVFGADERVVSVPMPSVRWKVGVATVRGRRRSEAEDELAAYVSKVAARRRAELGRRSG